MSTAARTRLRDAQFWALVALLALLPLIARWHPGPWWIANPPATRWLAAGALVAAFVAACTFAAVRRHRAAPATLHSDEDTLLIAWASQTGFAHELAGHTARVLEDAGRAVRTLPLEQVDARILAGTSQALFIVSTTGEGDAPDHASGFVRGLMGAPLQLAGLQHAVLALGDRHYTNYCAFGRALDAWLQASGARPLFDRVEVDAGDDGALRHWQHHLAHAAGDVVLPDWTPPRYGAWRLAERRELNAGSVGAPVFHIALVPDDVADLGWQAGDILEIGPCHAPGTVDAWLATAGVDGDARVDIDGERMPLRELLARSRLPDPATLAPRDGSARASVDPAAIARDTVRLPHREYSIASLPADGALHLLVRQVRRDDGALGLGSGWLTAHAATGTPIAARIRRNPSFHAPADDRPLVLIGNGTGIAGLRALLKARVAAGHRRNWLVFGERQLAHDLHYADDLAAWQRAGLLERTDLVFSRDPTPPGEAPARYVQDRLRQRMPELREWIAAGAAVYVCGSLEGMAPGVDAVLREALGDARVVQLTAEGRYRRDVY